MYAIRYKELVKKDEGINNNTGVDYSGIKIRYMVKVQEQAKSIERMPEQNVLEHEEQEQHAPVQTM